MAVSLTPSAIFDFRFAIFDLACARQSFDQKSKVKNQKWLGLRFLFRRSISGLRFDLGGRLAQGLVDQSTYFNTFFYSLIQDEIDHRRKPGFQAVGQLGLNEPGRMAQAMETKLLLAGCPHDRDVHL